MSESQAKTMFCPLWLAGVKGRLAVFGQVGFFHGNGLDTDKIRAAFRLSLARDGLQF